MFKRLIAYVMSGALLASCSYQDPISVRDESLTSHPIPSLAFDQSPRLALASVAARIRGNNPRLRAARERIAEARGRLTQAGRPSNPNLRFGTGKTGIGGEWELNASFSQSFPITNRLALEKRVSKLQLAQAQAELANAERLAVAKAQHLAIELLALKRRDSQLETQISLLQQIANFIESSAERGEMSPLEANQARVEVGKLRTRQQALNIRYKSRVVTLKAMLGLDDTAPLDLIGALDPPKSPNLTLQAERRPDYLAKQEELSAARAAISLEKSRRFGDVTTDLQAGVAREEDAPDGLETEIRIGAGMSIPLPFYNQNQGNIEAAQAQARRVQRESEALLVEIQQQAASARVEMLGYEGQHRQLRSELIPQAADNSEQLETAFRNGQASFVSLLQARQQELELQAQLISNLRDYHLARVRYFAAHGRVGDSF